MKAKIQITTLLILCVGVSALFAQTQLGADINGEAVLDRSGRSVALSYDGTWLAVGADANDGNGASAGQVRVYHWNGQYWTQFGGDIDGEAAGDEAGKTVAISADGEWVAIGAPFNDGNGDNAGQVRVYRRNSSGWTQVGADIDGESAGDESGTAVAISADGSRVAIGAKDNDGNGHNAGQVRVYDWTGSQWVQAGADIDGESASSQAGKAVSMSADGRRVAIGESSHSGHATNAGQVRIFDWIGGSWVQAGWDLEGEAADDHFGWSVSLSAIGHRVAIGAQGNDDNGDFAGHVRVFEWDGTNWLQMGIDIDGEAADNESGFSVSLSVDGQRLAIGAPFNDGNGDNAGHVRLFEWDGMAWIQLGSDIDGEAAGDFSGEAVSLSTDGRRVAIGAYRNDGNGTWAGQARVFELSGIQGKVVRFEVTNANNDYTYISDLANDPVIDLNLIGNIPLNIRAVTIPAHVGSVTFELTGPLNSDRTENSAPYFLFGNSPINNTNNAKRLPPGPYTLSAQPFAAAGGNGAAGTPLEVDFQVVFGNQQPHATFSYSPTGGNAPLTVHFDASASSDPDGVIVDYFWDFGNGQTATGPQASVTYTATGFFHPTLTVTDNEGAWGFDGALILVTDGNEAPIASFVSDPVEGNAPLTVDFDGTNSVDLDGTIVSYAWDFGDGSTDVGVIVSHTYTVPGVHNAVLIVTDDEGATGSTTRPITVGAAGDDSRIISLQLTGAQNSQIILPDLQDGSVIDLNIIGNIPLNIRAFTHPGLVGSVAFALNGPFQSDRIENVSPYFLFGDNANNTANHARRLLPGQYTLTVQPFAAVGGGGMAGTPTIISFTVVAGASGAFSAGTEQLQTAPLEAATVVRVYPNPVTNNGWVQFTVIGPAMGQTEIRVLDQTGRLVYQKQTRKEQHVLEQKLPIVNLPPGGYTIQTIIDGQAVNTQLIIGPAKP